MFSKLLKIIKDRFNVFSKLLKIIKHRFNDQKCKVSLPILRNDPFQSNPPPSPGTLGCRGCPNYTLLLFINYQKSKKILNSSLNSHVYQDTLYVKKPIELSLCHKLKCFDSYIFATWRCKPLTKQILQFEIPNVYWRKLE